jgi:murein DD-endopeptidase MepM/ murein hydrolase activator NlpD
MGRAADGDFRRLTLRSIAVLLLGFAAGSPVAAPPPRAAVQDLPPTLEKTAPAPIAAPVEPTTTEKSVRLSSGETLTGALIRAGADRQDAQDAVDALAKTVNPRKLPTGLEIKAGLESVPGMKAKKLLTVAIQPDATREVVAIRNVEGRFAAHEIAKALTREAVRAAGRIEDSLFMAATRAGVPIAVLSEMIRLYSYDVDFQREIQPGDAFELYFERMVDAEGVVAKTGHLLHASLTLSGTTLRLYRHAVAGGRVEYYDDKGRNVRKALLKTPIDGAKLSSSYGMRHHPILGFNMMHRGIDFAAPVGTPIVAAGDGTVEVAGRQDAYGNYVRIRHTKSHATAYAHLSRFAPGTKAGKRVRQGEVIGYVGSTGRSTGPHLHFEMLVGDRQVNPLSIKSPPSDPLLGKELALFMTKKKELDAAIAAAPVASQPSVRTAQTRANSRN